MQTHKNPNLSLVAPTIGVDSIRLPEAGLYGNTYFPMSDINNMDGANFLSKWLKQERHCFETLTIIEMKGI